MKQIIAIALSSITFAAAGCATDSDTDTTARGACTYEDAETDHQGNQSQPESPPAQTAFIEVRVEGSAQLSGLDPQCLDGVSGSFRGLYDGDADISSDGAYIASMSSSQAEFTTPSGCEIPSIDIATVNEVVVRATLQATTTNCERYCTAKARSHAEGECGTDASAASCRAASEASYESSCTTSCTQTRHVIVAEAVLSAQTVAQLNAQSLSGGALGSFTADLTFDHIEDESGNTVAESN